MIDPKFTYDPIKDNFYWERATIEDAEAISQLAYNHYKGEIDVIFTPSAKSVKWNVSRDIIEQSFDSTKTYICVAKSKVDNHILAYCWFCREYMIWSPDECVSAKMMHIELTESYRQRVRIIHQMIDQLHLWAQLCGVKILLSTTVRNNQDGFLRLHANRGFTVRGSFCFKRIE